LEVTGTGVVAALPEAVHVVAPAVTGRVTALPVAVGAAVRRGDVVCELMPDPAVLAEIDRQRRTLEQAERNLVRQRRALEAGVSPRIQVEQAEIDLANARSDLAAHTRDFDVATQRVRLRAPLDGFVTAVDARLGALVDATTGVITVVDPDNLAADVRLDDMAGAKVVADQPATVMPLATGSTRVGRVLRTAHVLDVASQREQAWIRFDGEILPLGTFVRARVRVAERTGVGVPRGALVKTDRGWQVLVPVDGIARVRPVEAGAEDDGVVEIRAGLAAGEEVVVDGAQELADGVHVTTEAPRP